GSQADKAVTDVGAGAGSQSRAADSHLILRPHEEAGCFVLAAVVRSFAPVEPLPLRWEFPIWTPADDLDASKLRGRLTRGEERVLDRDKDGKEKLVQALQDGPKSESKLRGVLGSGRDRTRKLLDILEAEKIVEHKIRKANGGRQRIYRLKVTK